MTGGAGFIGSHVVEAALRQGWDVVVLDDLSTGRMELVDPAAEFVRGSVTDGHLLADVLRDADYVFHLAALPRIQPSFDDPLGHEEVNVVGTLKCLEAVKGSARLRKFVFSASSSCYGDATECPTPETAPAGPQNPYALQKYTAEQYVLILGDRFDMPVISLRYMNVYGPRSFNPQNAFNAYSSVVGIFHRQRQGGHALTVTGDGEQRRDFVHVFDVARANLMAAVSDRRGESYNVGFGRAVSINELARTIGGPIVHIPERKGEARVTWADTRKIREHLGWECQIDLATGLECLD